MEIPIHKETTTHANEMMCAYCFDVLIAHFRGQRPSLPPFDGTVSVPMFVTLNSVSQKDSSLSLRGCIGTLSPKPLSSLADFTHSSAFRDRRFEPLLEYEIASLEISVSLLVAYEDIEHYLDWEVGVHGILIEFEANNRKYSGTYLPEVALAQRWTQQEAIYSLIRKAGYQGAVTTEILNSIRVTRYQSSKASLSYEKYGKRFHR
mmetsp:Transcript_8628/g.8762  ORF Transcript_8628/g.8762 Transcript_8628/m.8762 type:complete len:205 (+) Transcript_8628:226-840(+)